jgi:hypothetical protein
MHHLQKVFVNLNNTILNYMLANVEFSKFVWKLKSTNLSNGLRVFKAKVKAIFTNALTTKC